MSGSGNTIVSPAPGPSIRSIEVMKGRSNNLEKLRKSSHDLKLQYEKLMGSLFPLVQPDEEQPVPRREESKALAHLGMAASETEMNVLKVEMENVDEDIKTGVKTQIQGEREKEGLKRRYHSAGNELWENHAKRALLEKHTGPRLLPNDEHGMYADCLLALYRKGDHQDAARKRPADWRQRAVVYYRGYGFSDEDPFEDDEDVYKQKVKNIKREYEYCHVTGWHQPDKILVKAAHIVPFFLDHKQICKMLFGGRFPDLEGPGNALMLHGTIKRWFDHYCIVIVPVDTNESPIKRWKVDVINPHLTPKGLAKRIDGKELTFLNENRPAARFLYFHFVMALIRIRNLSRPDWKKHWDRYRETRPFPTPCAYIRKSMLLTLATYYGSTDMDVVQSWINDNGFEDSFILRPRELEEVANRIHQESDPQVASTREDPDDPDPNKDDVGSDAE